MPDISNLPGPARPPLPEGLQGEPPAPPPGKGLGQKLRNLLNNKDFNQMSLQGQIEYVGKKFPEFKDLSAGEFQLLRNKVGTSPIEDVSGDLAGLASAPKMLKDVAEIGFPALKGGLQALGETKTAGVASDVGKTIGSKILPKTRKTFGEFRAARAAAKSPKGGPQAITDRPGLTMPKFGGRMEEELQAFGKTARRGRNRAMEPEPKGAAVDEAEEALGAPGKPAKPAEKPAAVEPEEPGDYYGKLTESIRQAAQGKDKKVADFLKSKGINKKKWAEISAEEKNKLIKQAAPSHRAYSTEKGTFRFNEIAKLLD